MSQFKSDSGCSPKLGLKLGFVTLKLDYCNSLMYDLPKSLFQKLQSVQSSAARIVTPQAAQTLFMNHRNKGLYGFFYKTSMEAVKNNNSQ
mgnify:CR=1 FL=1